MPLIPAVWELSLEDYRVRVDAERDPVSSYNLKTSLGAQQDPSVGLGAVCQG